jgi:acyl-ACP thioesterase
VWVAIDRRDGRPAALGAEFHRLYGPSARGRRVSARLSHPSPPQPAAGRAWPLRASDFDRAGHVNNSIHWAAVEDVLAEAGWLPARAELEYHRPVLPGCVPCLSTREDDGRLAVWLVDGEQRLASARLDR